MAASPKTKVILLRNLVHFRAYTLSPSDVCHKLKAISVLYMKLQVGLEGH